MFGERLSEIRKDHGHTQADLANLLHVSVYSISAYEQGKTWPTLGTLRNICRIYKVSSDYLLDLTDDYWRKPQCTPQVQPDHRGRT